MKITFLIIFLVFTNIIFGQKDSTTVEAKISKAHNKPTKFSKWVDEPFAWLIPDYEIDSKICLKFSPLSFIDIYNGSTARIGVEYKLRNNYSLYNEIGTFIPTGNKNSGILTRCEFKWYFNSNDKINGQYVSLELFYKNQSYNTTDSIRSAINYSQNYSVSKDVGCLTIKYGFMQVCKFRFVIDGYIGLGVRGKIVSSSLTNDQNNNLMSSDDSYNINLLINKAGTFIRPNVDIGFKIGYRIK